MEQALELIEQIKSGSVDIQDFIKNQGKDTIQNRLMGSVSDEYDKTQGSFMYDTITPTTLEFVLMYLALSQVLKVINPNTTYGEFLKGYASSLGVDKKDAGYASGYLLAVGAENTVIPKGQLFSTEVPANQSVSPKYFVSTQEVVISQSGTATVPIIAQKAGASQNVRQNEIVVVCKTISGLTSITNPESITNGTDEETDSALLARFSERAQNPPSSGNKRDYERWAKEIQSVDEVIVEPLWAGPGTVKLTIICNGEAADQSVIDEVKQYIDPYPEGTGAGEAPIGAIVTVGTVIMSNTNIKIPNIRYKEGADVEAANAEILSSVAEYLKSIPLGGIVRIVKIEAAIGSVRDVIGFDDVLIALDSEAEYKNEDIQLAIQTKTALGEVMYI